MENKCNKVKNTCANKNYAECIIYESEVNETSPLKTHCALSIEETTQDIYNQLEEINLSELGEYCMEYILDEDDKIIVKNVLLKFEEKICELEEKIEILESTAICDKDITACDLEFGNLTNVCNTQPSTMKDVLQLILDNLQTP